jgi:L-amino acid N-acyltransferase YncA
MGRRALNLQLRPVRPGDLGAISDIFGWYSLNSAATFEEEPRTAATWADLAAELDRLGLPFLVAELDGSIAGYAYAGPWRRKPAYRATVEDSIFIAPGRTGLGLGGQLLPALLSACASAGARQVIAVIADTGEAAGSVRLHQACGFTDAGRLTKVGFKHGQWIDTLLMQRSVG